MERALLVCHASAVHFHVRHFVLYELVWLPAFRLYHLVRLPEDLMRAARLGGRHWVLDVELAFHVGGSHCSCLGLEVVAEGLAQVLLVGLPMVFCLIVCHVVHICTVQVRGFRGVMARGGYPLLLWQLSVKNLSLLKGLRRRYRIAWRSYLLSQFGHASQALILLF